MWTVGRRRRAASTSAAPASQIAPPLELTPVMEQPLPAPARRFTGSLVARPPGPTAPLLDPLPDEDSTPPLLLPEDDAVPASGVGTGWPSSMGAPPAIANACWKTGARPARRG